MAIALVIIMTVLFIKYKLVCEVTSNGESLGYITDKQSFEQAISNIINKEEENKLYTKIEGISPEYNIAFVNRLQETNMEDVLTKIEEAAETTYKLYAVTVEGKEKAILTNLEEAEKLVKELNEKYKDNLKKKIGVVEVITTDNKKDVVEVKTAKTKITGELDKQIETNNKVKVSTSKTTTNSNIVKTANSKTTKTTTKTITKTASIGNVKFTVTPISGTITSRFGSRESIRSRGHSGLDIAAPKGTKIKAAASGTVIFAGYSGGYGNVVKISHGNGVKTYYAHCSKIYVTKGQKVSAGDVIAAVGSTGNSTGNHLHFEVVINGTSVNPQKYLY